MSRKRLLTIEVERVRIIAPKPVKRLLFCSICNSTGEFVGVAEAVEIARFIGAQNPEIFHFQQTSEKKIFVCLNSIFEIG